METVQAPKIEAGAKGRLVYDKVRRTIVGKQAEIPHHLAKFGYRRLPQWIWRASPRAAIVILALQDIWLIATGRCTLHRAWQAGHDDGHLQEVARQLRGGR